MGGVAVSRQGATQPLEQSSVSDSARPIARQELAMTLARFYIVEQARGWCIRIDGEMTKPYATRDEATRSAIKTAIAMTEAGHQAEIYLDGDESSTVPVWWSGGVPVIH
jgi:hypothetical protein